MPIISQFYGIIIRIFYKDTQKHHGAHLHVEYNEYSAVYSINSIEILEGYMPPKQNRMVIAWMEIHKEELIALWKISQDDGEFFKIEPLK